MALGVRQGQYVFVGFDEELRSVAAADDGEKRIPIGSRNLVSKPSLSQ
jgi:hypothetical protein